MIRDHIIIGVGSNWAAHPTSKHHVMRLLAENNHVIWINYHASRRPRINWTDFKVVLQRLRQSASGNRRSEPNIDVLSPLLLPFPESPISRFLNSRQLLRHINSALKKLPALPIQLWLFTPDVPELIDQLKPEQVVYYCVDDFAAFKHFNVNLISGLEARTCRRADHVLATSEKLFEKCRRLTPRTHLIMHGVDYEHFAATASVSVERTPPDIREIPKPVLGYFGLISDYVDVDLIADAARRRPDWSFVLIGSHRCNISMLAELGNVHLLGPKSYEELPRYCRAFDVGLIPFRMNRLTRAVNPIKLREYLAAGLPVVSAPMPEVLRYAPAVLTAATSAEFLAACEKALTPFQAGGANSRRKLVRDESWRARIEQISRIMCAPLGTPGDVERTVLSAAADSRERAPHAHNRGRQ